MQATQSKRGIQVWNFQLHLHVVEQINGTMQNCSDVLEWKMITLVPVIC